jgi:hypothetical protein
LRLAPAPKAGFYRPPFLVVGARIENQDFMAYNPYSEDDGGRGDKDDHAGSAGFLLI